MSNKNTLYASILVDELVRAGLRHVCLAPGSRNTPLVLAFARHTELQVTSHLDERCASFFALGLALATNTPVAIVCTSGSAAANFFPAIVEAHQAQVALIVLTADRPHEVRDSGANQTIDQVKIFGGYALWSVDMALPEANPPALAMRNLRTIASRAMALAGGLPRGVVHLNLPFRPPLEPTAVAGDLPAPPIGAEARRVGPFTQMTGTATQPDSRMLATYSGLFNQEKHGIIVCGPCSPGEEFGALVSELSARTGYPVLSDGTSGLRFGNPGLLGGYDTWLASKPDLPMPRLVLRFGAVPTSKWLNQYLDAAAAPTVIHVRSDGIWADDSHRVSDFVQVDEAAFVRGVLPLIEQHSTEWRQPFDQAEQHTWAAIADRIEHGPYFDGAVVHDTVELLPAGSGLFVGNSLPVRHLDQFGQPGAKPLLAYASRGASGIDGNISTALGLAAGQPERPFAAIIGDVTFYHDMNGLLAVRRCGVPITIVLLHNDGGGIFHRLPINQFEPEFSQYFLTPHGLEYEHAARMYGLEFVRVHNRQEFRHAFSASIVTRSATIIEYRSDARADLAAREALMA